MKILLQTSTMGYLSGAPLYYYTLALELSKVHQVTMVSNWLLSPRPDPEGYKLKEGLEKAGVICLEFGQAQDTFDLGIFSHTNYDIKRCKKTIYVVHSEYDCEAPVLDDRISAYVGIRPSIVEHIIKKYGISKQICHVIYNGVDRQRFNPKAMHLKRDKIFSYVIPCTLDVLRQDFLNYMISKSSSSVEVNIYGLDCGAKLNEGKNVKIFPPTFDIQKAMASANSVAGILLGRVNLEACSMGITSEIYDPVTLECKTFIMGEKKFDQQHNIINVAKNLLKL